MILSRKTIDGYIEEFEKKEAKYEGVYQASGNPSSLNTREKYSDLVEICLTAKRAQGEADGEKMRRLNNCKEYIRKVEDRGKYNRGKTYTIEELIDELNKLVNVIC